MQQNLCVRVFRVNRTCSGSGDDAANPRFDGRTTKQLASLCNYTLKEIVTIHGEFLFYFLYSIQNTASEKTLYTVRWSNFERWDPKVGFFFKK